MDKNSTLSKLYKHYLEKCKLDESNMPKVQIQETRRAFFGGCSSMLTLLTTDEELEDEDKGIDLIAKLYDECSEFWNDEIGTDGD